MKFIFAARRKPAASKPAGTSPCALARDAAQPAPAPARRPSRACRRTAPAAACSWRRRAHQRAHHHDRDESPGSAMQQDAHQAVAAEEVAEHAAEREAAEDRQPSGCRSAAAAAGWAPCCAGAACCCAGLAGVCAGGAVTLRCAPIVAAAAEAPRFGIGRDERCRPAPGLQSRVATCACRYLQTLNRYQMRTPRWTATTPAARLNTSTSDRPARSHHRRQRRLVRDACGSTRPGSGRRRRRRPPCSPSHGSTLNEYQS